MATYVSLAEIGQTLLDRYRSVLMKHGTGSMAEYHPGTVELPLLFASSWDSLVKVKYYEITELKCSDK